MKKLFSLFSLLVLMFFSIDVNAVPAHPGPIEFIQPDGSAVTIFIKGDEKVNWRESLDGYTLLFNDNGFLTYGITDEEGFLRASNYIATEVSDRSMKVTSFLNTIDKKLFYNSEQISMMTQIWQVLKNKQERSLDKGVSGNFKTICALVDFPEKKMIKTKEEFDLLMNQIGYSVNDAIGSVKDYFRSVSYNKVDMDITVVGPFTAPEAESYYAGSTGSAKCQALATWAIKQSATVVNIADFDNDDDGWIDGFHFIYAGIGQEAGGGKGAIWSHKSGFFYPLTVGGKQINTYSCSSELSSGTLITNIGVVCHELTHAFGAPDYYDTDYDKGTLQYEGTGTWDLMAGGSWNGSPSGSVPANINMYQRIKFKWVEPIELTSAKSIFHMPNSSDVPVAYIINTQTNNEYFVLENRQKIGFDASLKGHGLLIYRAHKNLGSGNGNDLNVTHPQKLYPVCASSDVAIPNASPSSYGNINSGECPFPGEMGITSFTDETAPSSKSWAGANTNKPITNITEDLVARTISFDFMGGAESDCGLPPVDFAGSVPEGTFNPVFVWNIPEDSNPTGYSIYRNGVNIADNVQELTFTDLTELPYGKYSYFATAVYGECESDPCISVVADIPRREFNVSVVPNIQERGKVTGAGSYKEGAIASLLATPEDGYVFVNYTENGVEVSTAKRYKFRVEGNVDLVANFELLTGVEIENASEQVNIFSFGNNISIVVGDLGPNGSLKAEIFDINGRLVKSLQCEDEITQLKIDGNGMYIVRLIGINKVISKKVIIK